MKRTLEWLLFAAVSIAVFFVALNAPGAGPSFQNFNTTQFTATATAPGNVSIVSGAIVTNLVSHGITAPGVALFSEAFGAGAVGGGANGTAVGPNANVSATRGVAVGNNSLGSQEGVAIGDSSTASGIGDIAIGDASSATGGGGVAIGQGASTSGSPGETAIGLSSSAGYLESTAVGWHAATTSTHQIMLGTGSETVTAPGNLGVAGTATLGTVVATNGVTVPVNTTFTAWSATTNFALDHNKPVTTASLATIGANVNFLFATNEPAQGYSHTTTLHLLGDGTHTIWFSQPAGEHLYVYGAQGFNGAVITSGKLATISLLESVTASATNLEYYVSVAN